MTRCLGSRLFLLLMLLLGMLPAAAQTGTAGPNTPGPTTPGPKLNVGDVLQVVMPGETAFANTVQVDREGRVELPEVGAVEIAGLTLAQAKDKVRGVLAQSFRDLSRFNPQESPHSGLK